MKLTLESGCFSPGSELELMIISVILGLVQFTPTFPNDFVLYCVFLWLWDDKGIFLQEHGLVGSWPLCWYHHAFCRVDVYNVSWLLCKFSVTRIHSYIFSSKQICFIARMKNRDGKVNVSGFLNIPQANVCAQSSKSNGLGRFYLCQWWHQRAQTDAGWKRSITFVLKNSMCVAL